MDGLLFLVILFWAGKAISKSAKQKTMNTVVKEKHPQVQAAVPPTVETQPQKQDSLRSMAEGESALTAFTASSGVPSDGEYMGSLLMDSDEGKDLCDPSLEHDRPERADPESVYAGEIGTKSVLYLSPAGLYQGIVMSEILARPAQRRHYGR